MKLLESKKLKLPKVFFVNDVSEIKKIAIGVPFIFGDADQEEEIIKLLEYEVLYQAALKTGYPFNFKLILKENGYDVREFWYHSPVYLDYKSEDMDLYEERDLSSLKSLREDSLDLKTFSKDASAFVNIEKLKSLNVFPIWLDTVEKAIETNIHNYAVFNPNMYNKKLDGMYGGLEFTSPKRNLIIIDISGSIPKAVSSTFLNMSKNLAESFYSDLLITGSKSTLYEYERLYELDLNDIYSQNGMDNDQVWFKNLVSTSEKQYETAIVVGDNHSPCSRWSNLFNKNTKEISRKDGKKLCKWKINKLISFHTTVGTDRIAGYADWFTISEDKIERIDNWVKYLN